MNKIRNTFAYLLLLSGLVSCQSAETEKKAAQTNTIPNTRSIQSITSGITGNTGLTNQTVVQPVSTQTVNAGNQINATVNPATTAGLNPAHGQPNHRCDIAVGAPLNSKPAIAPVNVQNTVQKTTPVQSAGSNNNNLVTPAVSSQTNVTAGLNPAHGQPNHRCDIAVGAPLNSAPAKNTPAQTQGAIQQAPTINTDVNKTNPNVKLNPPHGQPGHDCAVKVGEPLKQQ